MIALIMTGSFPKKLCRSSMSSTATQRSALVGQDSKSSDVVKMSSKDGTKMVSKRTRLEDSSLLQATFLVISISFPILGATFVGSLEKKTQNLQRSEEELSKPVITDKTESRKLLYTLPKSIQQSRARMETDSSSWPAQPWLSGSD